MGRVTDAIAATRNGTINAFIDNRLKADAERRQREPRNALTVTEAAEAFKDGTFDAKTRATAEQRANASQRRSGGIKRGTDLYNELHNKEGK